MATIYQGGSQVKKALVFFPNNDSMTFEVGKKHIRKTFEERGKVTNIKIFTDAFQSIQIDFKDSSILYSGMPYVVESL